MNKHRKPDRLVSDLDTNQPPIGGNTDIRPMGVQATAPADVPREIGDASGEAVPVAAGPAVPSLMPGLQIGDFVIGEELGRGGMGTVYAADHPQIQKRAAIKVLSEEVAKVPGIAERFLGEARAVNRIGHPNIIDIFAFGELPDGRPYYLMERLEGQTLCDRLQDGAIPASESLHYVEQICDALQAAHEAQVVHRDLKPENIWIAQPRRGEPFIKLLDFGIAKLLDRNEDTSLTQTGAFLGSAHFTSPEQIRGVDVDHRTDIYALGVILYELFAGTQPFDGNTMQELVAKHLLAPPPAPSSHRPMPAAIEQLILACLKKDPCQRPKSASEVWHQLNAAANAPVMSNHPSAGGAENDGAAKRTAIDAKAEQAWQEKQRRASRWLALALVGLGAAILAVAAQQFLGSAGSTRLGPATATNIATTAPPPPGANRVISVTAKVAEPDDGVRPNPTRARADSTPTLPPRSKDRGDGPDLDRAAKRSARRRARLQRDKLPLDMQETSAPKKPSPSKTLPSMERAPDRREQRMQETSAPPATRVEAQGLVSDNPFN